LPAMSRAANKKAREEPSTCWIDRPERRITSRPFMLGRFSFQCCKLLKQLSGFVLAVAFKTDHRFQFTSRGSQIVRSEVSFREIKVGVFEIRRLARDNGFLQTGDGFLVVASKQGTSAKIKIAF